MTQSAPFYGWHSKWNAIGRSEAAFRVRVFPLRFFMAAFGLDSTFAELGKNSHGQIRQSTASLLFAILGGAGAGLMLTYGGALWFPVVTIGFFGLFGMSVSALLPEFIPEVTQEDVEPKVEDSKSIPKVALGVAGALSSFMVLYWVLNPIIFANGSISYTAWFSIFTLPTATAAQQDAAFFFLVATVPWAEESFFRGLIGGILVRYVPEGFAEVIGGSVFAVFHSAVYALLLGPNGALIGLLTGAGSVFIFVDAETQDIITSELGHSSYNGLAFGLQGNILGKLIGPPPAILVPQIILPLALGLTFGIPVVRAFRKRGKGPVGPTAKGSVFLRTLSTRIGRGLRPASARRSRYLGAEGALEARRG